jgi:hypothetical protein
MLAATASDLPDDPTAPKRHRGPQNTPAQKS